MSDAMKIGESIAQRDAVGKELVKVADKYREMVVFDSDVCASTKTSLFRDAYPDRFYEMGIAEANMVTAAAAMSTLGYTPFVSAFSIFLAKRALDQIRVAVAYAETNVKINGGYGGLPTGRAGATHSTVEDISIMRCMPNMKVIVPADGVEAAAALHLVMETPGPVYMRTTRDPVPVIFEVESHTVNWGKGFLLADGEDIAIIATGMMTAKAMECCRGLEKEGIRPRLIHMPSIKPIDRTMIVEASRRCGAIVTVENHGVFGGLGGAVAEVVTEEAPCFVERIGFPDIFMESGDNEVLFSKMGMNVLNIKEKVMALLKRKGA